MPVQSTVPTATSRLAQITLKNVFVCLFCLHISICTACVCGDHSGQASDPLQMELQLVVSWECGCWELNSGSLEEQTVLLTTEPSLQPLCPLFICYLFIVAHVIHTGDFCALVLKQMSLLNPFKNLCL